MLGTPNIGEKYRETHKILDSPRQEKANMPHRYPLIAHIPSAEVWSNRNSRSVSCYLRMKHTFVCIRLFIYRQLICMVLIIFKDAYLLTLQALSHHIQFACCAYDMLHTKSVYKVSALKPCVLCLCVDGTIRFFRYTVSLRIETLDCLAYRAPQPMWTVTERFPRAQEVSSRVSWRARV